VVAASMRSKHERAATLLAVVLAALLLAAARPAQTPKPDAAAPGHFLAGKLLVAAPTLSDPRFRESVVLMVEHNAEGAFGVIVNKPMGELDTGKLFARFGLAHKGPSARLTVFFGGPVEPKYSFVVHGADFAAADTRQVTEALFISPEIAVVAAMAEDKGPKRAIFAVGYAGWGPDQLEGEMRRDDWFTAPTDTGLIFGTHHDTKWKRALALRYRSL